MEQLFREQLAAVQHKIWSHWMRYLFKQCVLGRHDTIVIPTYFVERWQRQMCTEYEDLSEREKEVDREQADKILAIL